MEGKNAKIVITVVVVLVVVGYVVYYFNQQVASPPPSVGQQSPSPTAPALPPNLTSDEQELLNTAKADATAEEQAWSLELAVKLAQNSDVLDVADCAPKPLVLRVKNGQSVTARNQDKEEVVLNLEGTDYSVPAGGTATFKVNVQETGGLFGYGCTAASVTQGGKGFILVPSQ